MTVGKVEALPSSTNMHMYMRSVSRAKKILLRVLVDPVHSVAINM